MTNIFATTLFFIYIYSFKFSFLPLYNRSLLGILGCIWFILNMLSKKGRYYARTDLFILLILLVSIGLISAISIGINNTSDTEFIWYVVSNISALFASYFVIKILMALKYELNFLSISTLIINVIFIQSIIASVMYIYPEVKYIIYDNIVYVPDTDIEIMARYGNYRVFGLGSYFFGAGVVNGFGLILISTLVRYYNFNRKQNLFLALQFLIIFTIGMAMARTTLIGAVLAIALILTPKGINNIIYINRKKMFFIVGIIIVPTIITGVLFIFSPQINKLLQPVFTYAFEMFVKYFNQGNFKTNSTDILASMYIFPENIKTWIIGDGLWKDGDYYYMRTDVGYSRLIYYFGLSGLIFFIFSQYFLISKSIKYYLHDRIYYLIFFCYFLTLNLKGFVDLNSFMMLYFIYHNLTKDYRVTIGRITHQIQIL